MVKITRVYTKNGDDGWTGLQDSNVGARMICGFMHWVKSMSLML